MADEHTLIAGGGIGGLAAALALLRDALVKPRRADDYTLFDGLYGYRRGTD